MHHFRTIATGAVAATALASTTLAQPRFTLPPSKHTRAVDVTVTVQNTAGASTSQTFRVVVIPDEVNSAPFLADIPELTTPIDTDLTYQLVAIDAEGDAAFYLDELALFRDRGIGNFIANREGSCYVAVPMTAREGFVSA